MIDACFIGIAWNTGDAFTYLVWTEPNRDWRQGKELVRNYIRPRKPKILTKPEEAEDYK